MTTFGTNYGSLELQYALAVQDAISHYLVDGTMPSYGTLYGNSEKRLAIAIVENTTIGGGGGGGATWGGITGTLSDQTDLSSALNGKQTSLVSGTNIKTINGESLLGSGNISTAVSSIVGITGTTAQFNTALTDNAFCTLEGLETLLNKIFVRKVLLMSLSITLDETMDYVRFNGTDLTATLPDVDIVPAGHTYEIKNINLSPLTVDTTDGQLIDDKLTITLSQYQVLKVINNSTSWDII